MILLPSIKTSPIGAAFNRAASDYDSHAVIQRRVANRLGALIVKSFKNKSPQDILEIGCGTGFLTEFLLDAHSSAPYYVTDIASSMVQSCLEKLSRFPNLSGFMIDGERIDAEKIEGKNLPSHVDWIVSSLVFQWFHDFPHSLRSLWTRTNHLAFSTLLEGTFQEWIDLCDHHNIHNTTRSFIREEDLIALCKSANPGNFEFESREETQIFKGPLEFLQSLKKIGARSSRDISARSFHNSGLNSPLSALLNSHPNDEEFTITYKVAYCVLGV